MLDQLPLLEPTPQVIVVWIIAPALLLICAILSLIVWGMWRKINSLKDDIRTLQGPYRQGTRNPRPILTADNLRNVLNTTGQKFILKDDTEDENRISKVIINACQNLIKQLGGLSSVIKDLHDEETEHMSLIAALETLGSEEWRRTEQERRDQQLPDIEYQREMEQVQAAAVEMAHRDEGIRKVNAFRALWYEADGPKEIVGV